MRRIAMKERYVDVRRGGVRRSPKRVEESIDASDMERWGALASGKEARRARDAGTLSVEASITSLR